MEPAEPPRPDRSDHPQHGRPAGPSDTSQSDALIATLLLDPSCPGRSQRGAREIEVDRFLAFAYSRGLSLAGLEPRVDRVVKDLGGRRTDPPRRPESSASRDRAARLPIYRLPEDAEGPAIRRTGRRADRARARGRTDIA